MPHIRCVSCGACSCGKGTQRVMLLPQPYTPASEDGGGGGLSTEAIIGIAIGAVCGAVLLAAAVYFVLMRLGIITRTFRPKGVTIVSNPAVHQPHTILCEEVDLEQVAAADPAIAAAAAALGYGWGIKVCGSA